jgi:hypothetical protein
VTRLWADSFAILFNVNLPSRMCMESHPNISSCIGQLEWLPQRAVLAGTIFTFRDVKE